MRANLFAAPTVEPLTIPEVRMHLRNPEITTNDAELQWFIYVAREQVENKLGRAILTQTWDATLDRFPGSYYCGLYDYNRYSELELPHPPLQSVTSITYLDENGAPQTLATTEYVVDTTGLFGRVRLAYGKSWPSTYDYQNSVTIRYVAGWPNAAQVPQTIKAYMRLLIEAMDKNRSLLSEREPFLTPFAERLLDPYRILSV